MVITMTVNSLTMHLTPKSHFREIITILYTPDVFFDYYHERILKELNAFSLCNWLSMVLCYIQFVDL